MKSTNWKCRYMINGISYERRIYEDIDGDWFIKHNGRFWDYELFSDYHYTSRWQEAK